MNFFLFPNEKLFLQRNKNNFPVGNGSSRKRNSKRRKKLKVEENNILKIDLFSHTLIEHIFKMLFSASINREFTDKELKRVYRKQEPFL